MNPDFTKFIANLKIARFMKGMSAREVSKAAGLRQLKRVSDIEDGRGMPSLYEVIAICKVLDQSMDDMITKTGSIHITFNVE